MLGGIGGRRRRGRQRMRWLEIVRGKAQGKKKKKRIDAIFSELRKMFIMDKKIYS